MKKKLFAILFAVVIMVASFGVVAQAETSFYILVSNLTLEEDYMTQDELVNAQAKGIEFENTYGYAVLFAVIDDELIDAYESAESLYFEMTDNADGMLVVFNEVDDEYDYHLAGDCFEIFDGEVEAIVEAYTAEDYYYDAFCQSYLVAEDIVTAFNSTSYGDVTESETEAPTEIETEAPEAEEPEAEEALPAVIDDANILKESEIKELDKKLRDFSKENGMAFAVITLEETGGISLKKYADNVYKYGGYKNSKAEGTVLCLYQHGDEGEREIIIVRYGDKAKEKLSDEDCSAIIGYIKTEIVNGNYAAAFDKFIEETDKAFNPSVHWVWIPGCLIIGLVIGFIIMKGVASANKSVRKKVNATDYVRGDSLTLTGSSEVFMYSELKTSAKSNNNTSSSNTEGGGRATSSGKF